MSYTPKVATVVPYSTIALRQDVAAKLWTLAAQHGLTAGDYVRSLLASYCDIHALDEVNMVSRNKPEPMRVGKDGKVRVRIRGNASEQEAAVACARVDGYQGVAELATSLAKQATQGRMRRRPIMHRVAGAPEPLIPLSQEQQAQLAKVDWAEVQRLRSAPVGEHGAAGRTKLDRQQERALNELDENRRRRQVRRELEQRYPILAAQSKPAPKGKRE